MTRFFSTTDTIAAIATPPGRGGIGVVRISGGEALAVARQLISVDRLLRPRYATLTDVQVATNDRLDVIDRAIVTYFPGPASYTGEDVVEISAHGSPVILRAIVEAAIQGGARLAEPGEFTLRAYINGRVDLMQAEAVADLIEAVTPLQARTAFDQLQGTLTQTIGEVDRSLFDLIARLEASVDFPDEGYHFADVAAIREAIDDLLKRTSALLLAGRQGRLIREGLQIAIVGPPNVGKSSLFNALAGASRAIVTEMPGTTRDLVTEVVDLNGLRVTLVDTAGVRPTDDVVEAEGVSRARAAAETCDLVLLVADQSRPRELDQDRISTRKRIVIVANKCDLPAAWHSPDAVAVSATHGEGLDALKRRIIDELEVDAFADPPSITNVRHLALVEQARTALERARTALGDARPLPEEFILADLQEARAFFDEITGRRTPDDVLAHIFERFCIGK